jgi:hypothetical protein
VDQRHLGIMPRLARLDAPGILHHIIIRGIERREIFNDDFDRENFLERLPILISDSQRICYAWVFMPNHPFFPAQRIGRPCPFNAAIADRICAFV